IAVILGLERGVSRIEGVNQRLVGGGLAGSRRLVRPAQIQPVQCVAHHNTAMLGVTVHELLVELLDPLQEGLLRIRTRIDVAIFVSRNEEKITVQLMVWLAGKQYSVPTAQSPAG